MAMDARLRLRLRRPHLLWLRLRLRAQLGTCAMKPRERGGVVDERLNVYGTDRLKVVDMSICPGNVAAVSGGCRTRRR